MGGVMCCGQRSKLLLDEDQENDKKETYTEICKTRNRNNSDIDIIPDPDDHIKTKKEGDSIHKSGSIQNNSELCADGAPSIRKRYTLGSQYTKSPAEAHKSISASKPVIKGNKYEGVKSKYLNWVNHQNLATQENNNETNKQQNSKCLAKDQSIEDCMYLTNPKQNTEKPPVMHEQLESLNIDPVAGSISISDLKNCRNSIDNSFLSNPLGPLETSNPGLYINNGRERQTIEAADVSLHKNQPVLQISQDTSHLNPRVGRYVQRQEIQSEESSGSIPFISAVQLRNNFGDPDTGGLQSPLKDEEDVYENTQSRPSYDSMPVISTKFDFEANGEMVRGLIK